MINIKSIHKLKNIVGSENVLTDSSELVAYSYDSQPVNAMPDAMVLASTTEEVAAVARLAAAECIPLVARGAGSGMTGGSIPECGGIVLNLERMNRIIHISSEDRTGYVQPGVITSVFQEEAKKLGLFYPPEPASSEFSSIGGNVAESAGGLGCVKYGLTKQFVEGLEFVTAGGEIVRTGIYTGKDSPFDVSAVFAGSEGTLAIITQIALRLIALPESRITVLALFRTLADAARASNVVLKSGAGPSVLEFMDGHCIDTVREYADVEIPADTGALLIAELDGDSEILLLATNCYSMYSDVLKQSAYKAPAQKRNVRNSGNSGNLFRLQSPKSRLSNSTRIYVCRFHEYRRFATLLKSLDSDRMSG